MNKTLKIAHMGPGNHPSGSPQEVHGGGERGQDDSIEQGITRATRIKEVAKIAKEFERNYSYIGIRVQEKIFREKEGEMFQHVSRHWTDGEMTGVETAGVSVVDINMDFDGFSARQSMNYPGNVLLILGANRSEYGDDYGEIVLKDAVVLKIIDDRKRTVSHRKPKTKANATLKIAHLGPGDHPSGSSQDAHGGGRGSVGYYVEEGAGDSLVEIQINEYIPEDHLDGLNAIKFHEGSLIRSGVVEAYGIYTPSTREIVLSLNGDNIGVFGGRTLVHEVGHHVHLSKLSDEGALAWNEISAYGINASISSYARTNRGEHFAEAYRAYMVGGDSRRKLKALEPRAYAYMRGLKKFVLPTGQYADVSLWKERYEG